MSSPAPPLCVHCNAQLAHTLNCYGRGLCAACFERFLELEGTAPPKDRQDIWGRRAAWGAPPENVPLCWHVAPGEDWSERWRDYRVEWVAVTPLALLMLRTESERCEQSGELRQIIRWRLWKAGVPGFVERFLAHDLSWETSTRKTTDGTYAYALHELMGKPRRGPRRRRGGMTPEDFKALSDNATFAHRAKFSGHQPRHDDLPYALGYSTRQWERLAREYRYELPA